MRNKIPGTFIFGYIIFAFARHIFEHPISYAISGLIFVYVIFLALQAILAERKMRMQTDYHEQSYLSNIIYIILSLLGIGILISEHIDSLAFP